jgi:type II secretory pathway predicted ATPase ExeA
MTADPVPAGAFLAHWGLARAPFTRMVDPAHLSGHQGHLEAVARATWAIGQRHIGVVCGETGAGKTLAVKTALDRLDPARHLTVYVADPTIGANGIRAVIATALGEAPCHSAAKLAVQAHRLMASELDERGRLPVLVIDEAHLMGNQDLEAIRMLTNTDMDTTSSFAVILIGQPTLRRRLKLAVLSALDQRVATRYTIPSMTVPETKTYLARHLAAAGTSQQLFADDAVEAIAHAGRGLPRGVNNIATAALVAAYTHGKTLIDMTSAQSAIADTTD